MTEVANHYIHDLQPFALQFTETIGIRWYGLSYLAGFVAGYLIIIWLAKKGATRLKPEQVSDFVTFIALGTLAGGRIGYCLFYKPELLTTFGSSFPWWGVLEVHKGGMASHGGFAGLILGVMLFARRYGYSKLNMLDITVFGGTLGIFFGRLANFINGELFGRVADESFKWAVKFPTEIYLWIDKGYRDKLAGLGSVVENLGEIKVGGQTMTVTASQWQAWLETFSFSARERMYDVGGAIHQAVQNGNMEVTAGLQTVLSPRHASQLYQGFLEGFAVFLILVIFWRTPKKPGVISALCGSLYAIARIIGEQFRMPDPHLGFQVFGLTRGQILSFAMLAACLVFLIITLRRDIKPVGGWQVTVPPGEGD